MPDTFLAATGETIPFVDFFVFRSAGEWSGGRTALVLLSLVAILVFAGWGLGGIKGWW